MAYFRCMGGGSAPSIKYKEYLGQLIERVSASTPKITESGHDGSYYAWGAFDGTSPSNLRSPSGNCWSATRDVTDAYIQYEFDRLYWFSKISIKCFSNYSGDWVGNIKVLGSADGVNWENILASGTNYELTAEYQTLTTVEINLNDSKEYQFIRIQADGNAFTVYYSPSCFFDEIYIYGGIVTGNGNATVIEGEFVSASTQYGIVDVEIGFEPDLLMVILPFSNGDTVSYWEKGLSYAQNYSIWSLYPAESVGYVVALGRQSGETGIQQINNDGFSFMSNGSNTRNVTCRYVAVKYEKQPDTVIKGAAIPTASLGNDGQIYLKYVPNDYTVLSYIQSDGNQYIDTGVVPTFNTQVKIKYRFISNITSYDVLIGSISGDIANKRFFPISLATSSVNSERYVCGSVSITQTHAYQGVREVDYNNANHEVIYEQVSVGNFVSATYSENTNTMYLFGAHDTNGITYPSIARLYYCQILDNSTGEILRDFVPVKRNSDDEIGLYDTVNDVFYANSGSGTFTAGSSIGAGAIQSAYAKVNGAWQELIGTDINDLGQIREGENAMINYSTTEQDTGMKWVDGKTIYQKTIEKTNTIYGSNTTVDTGVTDLENIISIECVFDGEFNTAPGVTASGEYIRAFNNGNGIVKLEGGTFNAGANRTWYLTIRYTKSTT